jgi:PAS domain S-box-containing protein
VDLRTKFVFALVAVSLVSMLALGTIAYVSAGELLTQKTLRQLDSLAEAKKEELEKIILGWQDRVSLIASRTQLRFKLREYSGTDNAADLREIQRILSDARRSSASLVSLTIVDRDGDPVASADRHSASETGALDALHLPENPRRIGPPEVFFAEDDEPRVGFVASLILEEERIGALRVVLKGSELIDLIQNFTGLGNTGETLVVLRDSAGEAWVLQPLRRLESGPAGPVRLEGPDDPATWAIEGRDTVTSKSLIDFRGEPVWAATRSLPEVGWGVVVKFDAAEEKGDIRTFRSRLTQLGLSLSAFAILLGTFLGLRFAKPIHDLATAAERIRLGELSARAKTGREDELGLLARTFNQMAEELEQKVTLLHEFRKYFEVSLDMLCIAGTDGYFKRVNPAFERTLGWSEEEMLSRPIVSFVHPDDVERTVREIEKLDQGIPTVSFTNCYRCADGSWKYLTWTAHPEPETGLIYAIARDVTDSRQPDRGARPSNAPEPADHGG